MITHTPAGEHCALWASAQAALGYRPRYLIVDNDGAIDHADSLSEARRNRDTAVHDNTFPDARIVSRARRTVA